MLWWSLLANADLGQAFSRYTRRSGSLNEHWYMLAVVVAIPLLWSALYYWDKYRKRFKRTAGSNAKTLFAELCRAHELSRAERSLLRRAIETKQLNQPALVFIDPVILGDLSDSKTEEAPLYAQLAKKLFGTIGIAEPA